MNALRDGRIRRGWSQTRAADETGVSRPHLSLLERGLRRPSSSVAEDLINAYEMTDAEAGAVRAIAVPWAGRDSPFRTGIAPGAWEP
jgi:transcriptional regulator with XRE-family HTH domain